MARTPSNMLPIGTKAPDFELPDTINGETRSLSDLTGEKGTVIMFICNHCPYVVHVIDRVVEIAKSYQEREIDFVAISSNDVENYPQDAPDKMKEFAEEKGFTFPYLYDESQEVARDYDAACTPDFYLFNEDNELVYRGQMDNSRPGNDVPVTGENLVEAMDDLLEGHPIDEDQKPSLGCNIKWKG